MRPVALLFVLSACGGSGEEDRTTTILGLTGDPANGEVVYTDNCAVCHLASGLGADDPDTVGAGSNLTEAAGEVDEDAEFIDYIINGNGTMTAFGDALSDQDIADVLAYLHDGLFN